jgi:hypothetical protein
MMQLLTPVSSALKKTETTYGISSFSKNAIMIAPIILLFLSFLFLSIRSTRLIMLWMLKENRPVELCTFLALLAGGLYGLVFTSRLQKQSEATWVIGFYMLFSLGLIVVGMEEIAWGQSFLKFKTPELFESINAQKELTLHNLRGLQRHSEVFRLIFGLGGLFGVMLGYFPRAQKIAAPTILLPCLLVITIHAIVDFYDDISPVGPRFNLLMQRTSEMVELLIGIAGLLYVSLNARMFSHMARPD